MEIDIATKIKSSPDADGLSNSPDMDLGSEHHDDDFHLALSEPTSLTEEQLQAMVALDENKSSATFEFSVSHFPEKEMGDETAAEEGDAVVSFVLDKLVDTVVGQTEGLPDTDRLSSSENKTEEVLIVDIKEEPSQESIQNFISNIILSLADQVVDEKEKKKVCTSAYGPND